MTNCDNVAGIRVIGPERIPGHPNTNLGRKYRLLWSRSSEIDGKSENAEKED